MAAYCGIEKQELIASIADSVRYLKELDLGPVPNAALDEFRLAKLLEALDNAQSDSALDKIMWESGIGNLLCRFHGVLSYEPETYPQDKASPDGAASRFRLLSAWGAFSPANYSGDPYE